MSAARLFILVIAAIAAIVLAFVVRGALGPKKSDAPVVVAAAPAAQTTQRVLVAKRDLPIGTRLVAGDMGWQDWPTTAMNPAYVTDGAPPAVKEAGAKGAVKQATAAAGTLFGDPALQSFVGAVVREPILSGEPIMARKTIKSGEGNYMSVVLTPGHRAMAVPVTVDSAAGGFIMPGDRVDVLYAKPAENGKGALTSTVLRNLRVLAIDQTAEADPAAKALVGAVATLEVAAGDAEAMAGAQAQAKGGGSLILSLRSYADAGGPSGRGGGASGAGPTVRVFRAGQASEVTVSR